jgi:beta-lactamase regulating signal transducer with metallopeptidase domain/uncharacterized protein YwgA
MSLLHSLWQSALLLLLYQLWQSMFRKQTPSIKRNTLLSLLLVQLFVSILTFISYFQDNPIGAFQWIESGIQSVLTPIDSFQQYTPWIAGIYVGILLIKVIQLTFHWKQLQNLYRGNRIKPGIEIRLFTKVKSAEFGIKRKVTVWLSHSISTPLTFGFFKPVILLPVALLNHLSIEETEALIIHELTHIKHNDYLLNLFMLFCEMLFFFNPAIQVILQKIRLEREKNCDVQVLHFRYTAIQYAEALLKAARLSSKTNILQLSAVFKNRQLLQRIRFFTDNQNLSFKRKSHPAWHIGFLIPFLVINLAVWSSLSVNKSMPAETNVWEKPYQELLSNTIQHVAAVQEQMKNNVLSDLQKQISATDEALSKLKLAELETPAPIEEVDAIEENFAIPAAGVETEPGKEFLISEENSETGMTITKSYKMTWINNSWKPVLQWMISETRPLHDSLRTLLPTDTIEKAYPAIQ